MWGVVGVGVRLQGLGFGGAAVLSVGHGMASLANTLSHCRVAVGIPPVVDVQAHGRGLGAIPPKKLCPVLVGLREETVDVSDAPVGGLI